MIRKVNIKDEYKPIIIYGILIFLFHILFTRLFIKTDDGNFLGIVNSPDFTYLNWLVERYNTVSGRTVGEFLLAFFLKHDLLLWKIINTVMITYVSYFWYRLSKAVSVNYDSENQVICCCGMFVMLVSCLNPSVFWYAGSFSYLWPFTGMLLTISPLVFYLFGENVKASRYIFSFFFAFIGTMQEQSAASCTALYIILLIAILVRKRNLKILMFLPLIPIIICDFFLFTASGAEGRNVMESQSSFPLYLEYSIFQKLCCGLSSFFANSYYLSSFLIIIFVALLSVGILKSIFEKLWLKNVLICVNIFVVIMCIILNYGISAVEKSLPHIIFRNAFIRNEFNKTFYLLFVLGCILTSIILIMVFVLIKYQRKIGVLVGICTAAGFCCSIVMSFSPTVFSSGQRVAFYTNMFVITSCIILFSYIPITKTRAILSKLWIVYAGITFCVNCFAFKLIEHPLMG